MAPTTGSRGPQSRRTSDQKDLTDSDVGSVPQSEQAIWSLWVQQIPLESDDLKHEERKTLELEFPQESVDQQG
jgi:hypothetical protein